MTDQRFLRLMLSALIKLLGQHVGSPRFSSSFVEEKSCSALRTQIVNTTKRWVTLPDLTKNQIGACFYEISQLGQQDVIRLWLPDCEPTQVLESLPSLFGLMSMVNAHAPSGASIPVVRWAVTQS
ncbi:hypothetical protein [Pseudomonas viridiflava]|uniref:hypothetical protein n=1 Tax=Pseudomonas viridiflava TaxID=33069 RepID=UPI00130310CF|nr:hypothetical protein [Pseudomonas viridiflava]